MALNEVCFFFSCVSSSGKTDWPLALPLLPSNGPYVKWIWHPSGNLCDVGLWEPCCPGTGMFRLGKWEFWLWQVSGRIEKKVGKLNLFQSSSRTATDFIEALKKRDRQLWGTNRGFPILRGIDSHVAKGSRGKICISCGKQKEIDFVVWHSPF